MVDKIITINQNIRNKSFDFLVMNNKEGGILSIMMVSLTNKLKIRKAQISIGRFFQYANQFSLHSNFV